MEDLTLKNQDKKHALLRLAGWYQRNAFLRATVLVILTSLVFWLLFLQIDFERVISSLGGISWWVWLVAAVLTFGFPVLSAFRWHQMLNVMGYEVLFVRCLIIIVGVWPLSAISPSKAGDLLKAVSFRDEIEPMVVAGSVLAERVLDVFLLAVCALVGGLYFDNWEITLLAAGILALVVGACVATQLNIVPKFARKYQGKIEELLQSFRILAKRPGALAVILFFTAANWLTSFLQTWLLFWAVGAPVTLGYTIAALPICLFVGLLPITIGGMGTRDGAMVYLFAPHATSPQSLAVALLYSFFGYWLMAVAGLPFMKKALNLR